MRDCPLIAFLKRVASLQLLTFYLPIIMIACTQPNRSSESELAVLPFELYESKSAEAEDLISHREWDETLTAIVSDQGEVNYTLLYQEPTKTVFTSYLKRLEAPISKRQARFAALAYWLNAYNALTVRHVLRYPKLKSVATAVEGSERYTFFKEKVHLVAGEYRSLDEIEHQLIRPLFKDARVHIALNCASKSCPRLSSRAFRASTVDAQLNQLARAFIEDPSKNELTNLQVQVSSIFKWYESDFDRYQSQTTIRRTKDHTGIRGFIEHFSDFKFGLDQELIFKDYDWSLNGQAPKDHWKE